MVEKCAFKIWKKYLNYSIRGLSEDICPPIIPDILVISVDFMVSHVFYIWFCI